MSNFFRRAMDFREKGLQYNLPVLSWPQAYASPADSNNLRYTKDESEHRLQVYSYLAMGYKGLSDFIYSWGDPQSIVTSTGVPTPMYDIVASVNPEVSILGNALKFATITT